MKRLALMAALVLLPLAGAHAPPPAKEYEMRILADYNDDWFGTQHGHNLVSLDLREAYNATLGDNVLIFRLMISGGYAGENPVANPLPKPAALRDVITFKADGQDKGLEFVTADNVAFTGTFDAVYGPEPVLVDGAQDGTRVFVTGIARFSSLGIQAGSKLTGWFVNGFADTTAADNMPEGLAPGAPEPPGTDGQVWFDIGEYTVRAPDYYVSLTASALELTLGAAIPDEAGNETGHDEEEVPKEGHDADAGEGHDENATADAGAGEALNETATIRITVTNLLADTPQTIRVAATAVGLTLDLGNGSARTIDLAGGASQDIELTITTTHESGDIPVHIMATSGLDGTAMTLLNVTVKAPEPAGNETDDHDDGDDHHEEKKDTPGFTGLAAASLLGAITIALRRRV